MPVTKHEHSRWKLARRLRSLSPVRIGGRNWRRRLGSGLQRGLAGLFTGLQLAVICESHPMIALQFEHEPWLRHCCGGGWLGGRLDGLGRRLAHLRLGIVVIIEIRNVARTCRGMVRMAQARYRSPSVASCRGHSGSASRSGRKTAARLSMCGGHKDQRSENGEGQPNQAINHAPISYQACKSAHFLFWIIYRRRGPCKSSWGLLLDRTA